MDNWEEKILVNFNKQNDETANQIIKLITENKIDEAVEVAVN